MQYQHCIKCILKYIKILWLIAKKIHIAPFFFYIWAPAPEELSACPYSGATEHALFYGLKIKE